MADIVLADVRCGVSVHRIAVLKQRNERCGLVIASASESDNLIRSIWLANNIQQSLKPRIAKLSDECDFMGSGKHEIKLTGETGKGTRVGLDGGREACKDKLHTLTPIRAIRENRHPR